MRGGFRYRGAGGELSVRSKHGTGTTFEIFLPETAEPEQVFSTALPTLHGNRGTETLWLVEPLPRKVIHAAHVDGAGRVPLGFGLQPADPHQPVQAVRDLRGDVRFGLRILRRSPVFAAVAAMAMFVLVVDTSLMNVSISAVIGDLDTSASAVQSARERSYATARKQAWMTIGLGLLFVCSKLVEWSTKIRDGYELTTNSFFTFYYFLTGIHVVHVLVGFGFLGATIHQLRRPAPSMEVVEAGGIYWHMVDFLWVIIFALLYVMR